MISYLHNTDPRDHSIMFYFHEFYFRWEKIIRNENNSISIMGRDNLAPLVKNSSIKKKNSSIPNTLSYLIKKKKESDIVI